MIKQGVENLINWLNINNIQYWTISSSRGDNKNNFVFRMNKEIPREKEIERMREILDMSENSILYVQGYLDGAGKTGNFAETWQNTNGQPVTQIGATPQSSPIDIDEKIRIAVEKVRLEYDRKDFENKMKDFKDEQKEFKAEKEGVIGLLVQKAAPVLNQFLQKKHLANVAGVEDEPIEVEPIRAKRVEEQEPNQNEEQAPFSNDEAECLNALMIRYKAVDPDFIQLIEKFVEFAESGEQLSIMNGMLKLDYKQIKDMIL